ncbi:conserved hypothetical protein [Methylocella tundrae]|nr:conserved hypothetical protein [Methylocella tundrae]
MPMFNLYEILQNAQNGQAVDNLAKQFNISPEQADAAVKALMPEISSAFLKRSAEPAAFGSILGALGDTQHIAAFADAAAAQTRETTQKGVEVMGQLFGSAATSAEIAQHAASVAGLSPALLQQMLPVIASMVMGGLSKGLANQGLGGLFGQLADAAGQGGLATILGSLLGGAPAAQANTQTGAGAAPQANPNAAGTGSAGGLGGLAGMFGTILGSFLGGQQPGNAPPAGGAAPGLPHGFDASAIQAGLEALTKMLQPGTPPPAPNQPSQSQQSGLENEIDSILDGKKRS